MADRELCLVVFFPELRGESEWNHEVEGFGEWLQQRYQAMEFSTAIGWSGIAATIQDLPECRKQARNSCRTSVCTIARREIHRWHRRP